MNKLCYESKFQKFYLIRLIQLFEDKTVKLALKEIKLYSINQTPRKQVDIQQQNQKVYDGETYISTKEYQEFLQTLPKLQTQFNLSEYLKKQLGSNKKQPITSVNETVSVIQQKKEKELQQIKTQKVINNFLKMRSMSNNTIGQSQINNQSLGPENKILYKLKTKLILVLISILFIYLLDDCYFK